MAIRPYQRQEQVNANARRTDFSAPAVADVGRVFRSASSSLLQAADPILKDRAAKMGQKDAGAAPVVRDEEGHLKRAEPLPGGGTAYREAFTKGANELYRGRLIFDAEVKFEQIRAENPDDPQKMLSEMQGYAEAIAETIPDDIRAQIEPDLFREALQRFNGANAAKVNRDRANLVRGLEQQYAGNEQQYLADLGTLAEAQDWEGFANRQAQWEVFAAGNREARKGLYALDDFGIEGERAGTAARLGGVQQEVVATQGMAEIIKQSATLLEDPAQLQMLEQWHQGDPTNGEGKVLGMSRDDYLKKVPTERARASLASWASARLTDLNAAAAAAEAARQREEKDKDEEQVTLDVAAFGADAIAGNPKARKAWNEKINRQVVEQAGNITQMMLGDGGRAQMVEAVRQTGILPDVVRTFLERQATGTNAHVVQQFVSDMVGVRGPQGQYNGALAWRSLNADTRAAIDRYRTLADQEVPTEVRRGILEDIATGKYRQRNVAAAFLDEDGKPSIKLYTESRDRAIKAIFGVDHSRIPEQLRRQVDQDVRAYLSAYGQDPDAAVRAAVSGVATMWTPHPLGVEGFIPTELAGLHLTPSQLDYAFGHYVKGKGFTTRGGAGFTQLTRDGKPRARLELADDSQLPVGVGWYRVRYYDRDGQQVDEKTINIDRQLAAHFGSLQLLEQKARLARINAAKAKRSRTETPVEREERLATQARFRY